MCRHMAGKEIHSPSSAQEVAFSNEKSRYPLPLKRQLTRRAAAITLTSALYLADGATSVNTEATPTPTATPVRKETETRVGGSIAMPDQQTLQAISAFGSLLSGLGLITATFALHQLRKQAKATENAAKATEEAVKATKKAILVSSYENLMTRGDSINATFLEHPELYSQLFETPHVGPESMKRTSDRLKDTQLLATALRFADLFEITLDLKEAIPEHVQESWRQYVRTSLRNSQSLRNLIRNTPWYGDRIKELCAEVQDEIDRETSAQQEPGYLTHRVQRIRRFMQPIFNIMRRR